MLVHREFGTVSPRHFHPNGAIAHDTGANAHTFGQYQLFDDKDDAASFGHEPKA